MHVRTHAVRDEAGWKWIVILRNKFHSPLNYLVEEAEESLIGVNETEHNRPKG